MLERMNDAAQNSESTPTHGVNGVHSRGYHGVHGVRKSCPRCRHVTCTCNAGKDRRNPGKDFWILLALLISPRPIVLYLIFSNICCQIAFRVMYACVHVLFSGAA